eukprot:TRINITY_DN26967_c0_g1_i1.p3 TRINITY_DN26967_c0_g1~~TRINITY_DN26967_c0_g1_i1.p3  ORF type:complete len:103 (+),score=5.48 TRINITY_DN26967_c0_g1_i1:220-528(+)
MAWRGALSQYLHEIRIHLCQTSPASNAVRQFVQRSYADLKAANPTLPILVRECSGVQPRLFARYDFGVEHSLPLDGLSEEQIEGKLKELMELGKRAAAAGKA